MTTERVYANPFLKPICIVTALVSAIVIIGWYVDYKPVLQIIPNAGTLKMNTALCFLALSVGAYFKLNPFKSSVGNIFIGISFIIALASLAQEVLSVNLGIDELLVEDEYSTAKPGRMSGATSFCFILMSSGLALYRKTNKTLLLVSQNVWLLTSVISFISVVTYVMRIPIENKTSFFSSMAIHTSLLFILLATALFLNTTQVGFAALLTGKKAGSKISRQLIPYIIFFPIALSFIRQLLVSETNLSSDLLVVINTVLFILLSLLYISILAIGLNRSDDRKEDLKLKLEEANEALSSFKSAIDSTSLVVTSKIGGEITDVNEKFSEATEYQPYEIIGKDISILFSENRGILINEIKSALKNDTFWEGEMLYRSKTGQPLWIFVSFIPLRNGGDNVSQFIAVGQDITKLKEAEQILSSQLVQKLRQKNQELEQFAYIASHDLQEPLRSVKTITSLLESEVGTNATADSAQYFEFINDATTRMSDLIKGLMDYARLGGERELEVMHLNKVVNDVLKDVGSRLEKENAQVAVGSLPELPVYKVEIRLLFQNLISNALKFKKPEIAPFVKVSATEKENEWLFKIEDNGIGIKERNKEKIFVIFKRLHKREQYEGTGIGLSHCKKIVQLHGGKIWVESEFGVGSTFCFTLPKQQFDYTENE